MRGGVVGGGGRRGGVAGGVRGCGVEFGVRDICGGGRGSRSGTL